jgi:hypothetical protein
VGLVPLEKQRQLNAVEAGLLELGQKRKMVSRDMSGPEQQIHAELHGGCLVVLLFTGRGRCLWNGSIVRQRLANRKETPAWNW